MIARSDRRIVPLIAMPSVIKRGAIPSITRVHGIATYTGTPLHRPRGHGLFALYPPAIHDANG
jgi:hypothetical protein